MQAILRGQRVVLVEAVSSNLPVGASGIVTGTDPRSVLHSHCVEFDNQQIVWVPRRAIRLESEMPLTSAVNTARRIAEQHASFVECDDFRDRLILACAPHYFRDNWTNEDWRGGARRLCEFADAVMAERARGAK
jgi:hypothetical protein